MLAENIPPRLLPRILGRLDVTTLYFTLIFGTYGAAQLAAGGWASIPMLLLATLTFLLPCALAAYELGTLFPGEGGIYIWAHKSAGTIHGFIAGWLSWVPVFLLLPLGATTVVAHAQFLLGVEWLLPTQVGAQMVFVLLVSGASMLRLRISQNYIRLMFFVALATVAAVFVAGMLTTPSANPVTPDLYSLSLAQHGALYSAAVLWLLGVEVPFNMGAEIREDRKAIGDMFLWGSLALVLGYILGIVGVLFSTPQSAIDVTTGVARAVATQSGAAGAVVALGIILAISAQDVAYMNTYSRLLFISGIEGRVPAVFGKVTETTRVPMAALALQTAGALVVIAIFASQPSLAVSFNFYIGALIVVWCCSLFYIYYGVVKARFTMSALYEQRRAHVWQIPGGKVGVVLTAVIGTLFNALAIYYVFAIPMDASIAAERWRLWLVILAAIVIGTGWLIFQLGQKRAAVVHDGG